MNVAVRRGARAVGSTALLGLSLLLILPNASDAQTAPAKSGANSPPAKPAAGKPVAPQLPPVVKKATDLFNAAVALQQKGKLDAALAAYRVYIQQVKTSHLPNKALLPAYRNLSAIYRVKRDVLNLQATLDHIVAMQPEDALSWADLALLAGAEHHYDAAQRYAERALKLKPPAAVAAQCHFTLGGVAVGRRDTARAVAEYSQAARLAPGNYGIRFNNAVALVQSRQFKQALVEAQQAHKLAPQRPEPFLLIADIRRQTHDLAGAGAAYAGALAVDPHNRTALFNRGLLLHQQGKLKEAIRAYLAVIALYPDETDARLNLGMIYEAMQNYVEARKQFLAAAQQIDRIDAHDTRALARLANAEMFLALFAATPARRQEMVHQAEQHLLLAQKRNPKDKALVYQQAALYRRVNDASAAEAVYRRRLAADPDEIAAYYGLADTLLMRNRVQDAIDLWRSYRKRHPDNLTSYREVVRLLETSGRWADAVQENELLAVLTPTDGGVTLDLARDYVQLGDPKKAEPLYRKLLTTDLTGQDVPAAARTITIGDRKAWRIAAWQGLADIEEKKQNFTQAVSYLERVQEEEAPQAKKLGRAPDHQVYLDIARLYQNLKQPEKAIQELTTLTKASPDDPVGFAELGRLYARQGKFDEGADWLRKASQRDNDPMTYALEAADLYRQHGKAEQAIAEYRTLQTKFPRDPRVLTPLGQALESVEQNEQALAVYNTLLQVDPSRIWIEDRKAILLTRLKRYDEARLIYEKMVDRNPNAQQSYADLSHLYQMQGKSPLYLAWLQPRAEKRPTDQMLLQALVDEYGRQKRAEEGWTWLHNLMERHKQRNAWEGYSVLLSHNSRTADLVPVRQWLADQTPADLDAQVALADALAADGKLQEARKLFQTLLVRPNLSVDQKVELHRAFAERLEMQQDVTAAKEQYQAILAARSQDFAALSALVRILDQAGRYADVITLCDDMLKRPDNTLLLRAQLLSFSGQAYEKRNNRSEALNRYHEALKANPADPTAKAALQRLGG